MMVRSRTREVRKMWAGRAVTTVGGAAALSLLVFLLAPGSGRPPPSHLALGRVAPVRRRSAQQGSPPATPSPVTGMSETTETVTIGNLVRSYEVFRPAAPVTARIPAIVMLHGASASTSLEESRDGLLPLAEDGQALLVYPIGYEQTWNAGSCCGAAQTAGIDDVSFVAVLQRVAADPGVAHAYLAGYSNGGKMAYRAACADPSLVTTVIVMGAVPGVACPPGPPASLLQLAGTRDERVSYDATQPRHTVNGFREATATGEVAAWRERDECVGAPATTAAGALRTQEWTCAGGTRVELATYVGGDHGWPAGGAGTPSAAQLIWVFVAESAP